MFTFCTYCLPDYIYVTFRTFSFGNTFGTSMLELKDGEKQGNSWFDSKEQEPKESLTFNVSTTRSSTWALALELLDSKSSISQFPFVTVLELGFKDGLNCKCKSHSFFSCYFAICLFTRRAHLCHVFPMIEPWVVVAKSHLQIGHIPWRLAEDLNCDTMTMSGSVTSCFLH